MSLGERIKTQRIQQIISQDYLATQLNVATQTIEQWEAGEALPDVGKVLRLSEIFGVTTDYLLKPTPNEAPWWEVTPARSAARSSTQEQKASLKDAIYPLGLVAFLVMGFGFGLWHPGWMAFSVAWAVDEIVGAANKDDPNIEFYGVATVIFLVMGFYFDMWQFAWLAYVVALVVEGALTHRDV